jgi:glycerol uptake facilitator-like aquaporin
MDDLGRKFFAEMIGTFFLASMVLITLIPSAPFPVQTAIAAGLTLGLCVYFVGPISGCHINPAITFAMLLVKQVSLMTAGVYWVAQFLGGLLALLLISNYVDPGQVQWLRASGFNMSYALGEIVGAMFFGFGVVSTVYSGADKCASGIIVGGSLLIGIAMAHSSSMGVLNPAVAVATKAWGLDYLLMPFVGTAIGGLVCKALYTFRR